jgi:protein-L-isoaspartate(D-aspartate) O-methyltransferase
MEQGMPDFAAARERMVERHIVARGLNDPLLLAAFRDVPRELFVAPADAAFAYDDGPLPIAAGQTISQPYIVALMISLARVRPGHRVLEVGAGSGYAAAVLGRIAQQVVAVERHADLAGQAAERVARLGFTNVQVVHGDGALGVPEAAPFDAIILSAAASDVPPALPGQLRRGGALVMPLGAPEDVQRLVRIVRREEGGFDREELGAVRFVPLVAGEVSR